MIGNWLITSFGVAIALVAAGIFGAAVWDGWPGSGWAMAFIGVCLIIGGIITWREYHGPR